MSAGGKRDAARPRDAQAAVDYLYVTPGCGRTCAASMATCGAAVNSKVPGGLCRLARNFARKTWRRKATMVRLTAELIARSPSFINTLKQRELELRGILQ